MGLYHRLGDARRRGANSATTSTTATASGPTPPRSRAERAQQINAAIKAGERIDAKLKKPVPVYWVYITAWATPDGVVQFRDDIYNRDGLGQYATTVKG